MVNLPINDNWGKTQKKCTKSQPITNPQPMRLPRWHLDDEKAHEILTKIPAQSTGENLALNNDVIVWAITINNASNIKDALTE